MKLEKTTKSGRRPRTSPGLSGLTRPLFVYFRSFSNTYFTEKTVGFSGIRTRMVGIDGKHADHHHGPKLIIVEKKTITIKI